MKKRVMAAILSLCMMLSLLPVSALADDSTPSDPLKPADTQAEKGLITLHKQAVRTGPDTWDVDLRVTTGEIQIQQQPLEVVFVLDKSGSLAWCTTTEGHTNNIDCYGNKVECVDPDH